ncbi:hypothetical protein WS83_05375 [Burkholderia sp. MSMB2042]|nr:hypothetical protein WS78_11525 [Burkholderia savannae]KVG47207.1 hypothetical protein WS77_29050 [Burkholderia sp. MSMB0265]KVG77980.1 hypothetical protein WS81_17620 [Burkholderia sp. MSMB2040]KVG95280.1 hypothetical protein WS83_05375 [Burkholderia sp. MSMB2042]KVG99442.1 hypothetical protein WS82_24880 [Burkholderia sp. MSMB2041]
MPEWGVPLPATGVCVRRGAHRSGLDIAHPRRVAGIGRDGRVTSHCIASHRIASHRIDEAFDEVRSAFGVRRSAFGVTRIGIPSA